MDSDKKKEPYITNRQGYDDTGICLIDQLQTRIIK